MRPKLFFLLAVLLLVSDGSSAQSEDAAAAVTTSAAPQETDTAVPPALVMYDVGRPFVINCTIPHSTSGIRYQWKKNGTAVEELRDLQGRYVLEEGGSLFRLTERSTEDDFGNYTCGVVGNGVANSWQMQGRVHAKLPAHANVVEGQKLKLVCKLIGKPYPSVTWIYKNASHNATDASAVLGDRVRFERSEQGVVGGELVVETAQREDAGNYTCLPVDGVPATVTLRVKDMYAALWPFLGICAEVFVLCAIILVYEKRRTKPELDDSDTDNHDQKKS